MGAHTLFGDSFSARHRFNRLTGVDCAHHLLCLLILSGEHFGNGKNLTFQVLFLVDGFCLALLRLALLGFALLSLALLVFASHSFALLRVAFPYLALPRFAALLCFALPCLALLC